MAYTSSSDIDGTILGTFRTKRAALAAAAAYDTPARRAAFTKRLLGIQAKAAAKAAATRRARAYA